MLFKFIAVVWGFIFGAKVGETRIARRNLEVEELERRDTPSSGIGGYVPADIPVPEGPKKADLGVFLWLPPVATGGGYFEGRITFANEGKDIAENAVITVTLPIQLNWASGDSQWSSSSELVLRRTIRLLVPGETGEFRLGFHVDNVDVNLPVSVRAAIVSESPEWNPGNNLTNGSVTIEKKVKAAMDTHPVPPTLPPLPPLADSGAKIETEVSTPENASIDPQLLWIFSAIKKGGDSAIVNPLPLLGSYADDGQVVLEANLTITRKDPSSLEIVESSEHDALTARAFEDWELGDGLVGTLENF